VKYKIKAGCLIDGKNPPKSNVIISTEDNIIKDITEYNNKINNNKEEIYDKLINVEKYTVLPGLINTHVHITMSSDFRKGWDAWLREEKEFVILKSAENARKMLLSGVTTARDCGAYSNLGFLIREGIEKQLIHGPRLLVSGSPITITGGHCHPMGLEADNKMELIKSVRLMNKLGADFIKLMATGGRLTASSSERRAQYSVEEMKVVVEEANQRNLKVTVHAIGTEGIINSVKAGVATIEHCEWLAIDSGSDFREDIIPEMMEKNIYVSPTLVYGTLNLNYNASFDRESRKFLKTMYRNGVKMLAGDDAGIPGVNFDQLPFSIKLLVDEIGLTNYDAIKAATSEAACALGIDNEVGTVEKGKFADMIVIDGDPLEDIEALKRIIMIIKDGNIVFP
jgi:imidazolonepropionase-like amidohydrolase